VDSNSDKKGDASTLGGESAQSGPLPDPGRRRFSRTALASSAVLLSLGNRSAWGQTVVGCMSVATLDSFNPATGLFTSAPGGRPEHNETLANEIHHVSFPDDVTYIGTGTGLDNVTEYSTCQDLVSVDGVCLVEGVVCPE
jgi:hypothetical protein